MYRLILLTASLIAKVQAVTWEDCSTTRSTDAVTFTRIESSPTVVSLPGDLNLNFSLTFKRTLDHAYLDLDIYRMILGFPLKIPCLNGTVVGSCRNIDACRIFRSILHDPNHQDDYGHQAESIMLHALGHYIQCPLKAEQVNVENEVFHLDPIPSIYGFLADGDYRITARAKQKIDGPYDIGCIKLNVTVKIGAAKPTADPGTIVG